MRPQHPDGRGPSALGGRLLRRRPAPTPAVAKLAAPGRPRPRPRAGRGPARCACVAAAAAGPGGPPEVGPGARRLWRWRAPPVPFRSVLRGGTRALDKASSTGGVTDTDSSSSSSPPPGARRQGRPAANPFTAAAAVDPFAAKPPPPPPQKQPAEKSRAAGINVTAATPKPGGGVGGGTRDLAGAPVWPVPPALRRRAGGTDAAGGVPTAVEDFAKTLGLEELFPGTGLQRVFNHDAGFRLALRQAMRADLFIRDPALSRERNAALTALNSTLHVVWDRPRCTFARLDACLRRHGVPLAGADLILTLGGLAGGEATSGSLLDIVNTSRREVSSKEFTVPPHPAARRESRPAGPWRWRAPAEFSGELVPLGRGKRELLFL